MWKYCSIATTMRSRNFGCSLLICLSVISATTSLNIKEVTEDNCEVCVKFLGKFIDGLSSDEKSSFITVEEKFKDYCYGTKKSDNRFCYYVGGLEESATNILRDMSKPISWSMPADKICMKLYKKDQQICDLRYEKEIDLSTANFKKMKVRELKEILSSWDETCRGCTEKTDYIKLIEDLLPKYAPESHKKREAKKEL